ncbi:uncharacterized protein G2W53_004554 [Senna tora]|uniref:Uncharacterized protein n=1 Tax=Senna tora TaxID=362788 RepID=A0A834XDR1_9FABA|nr:uncharacterized protein G2W53_004554 [Senna tora]
MLRRFSSPNHSYASSFRVEGNVRHMTSSVAPAYNMAALYALMCASGSVVPSYLSRGPSILSLGISILIISSVKGCTDFLGSTKVDTPRWAPIDESCYRLEELPEWLGAGIVHHGDRDRLKVEPYSVRWWRAVRRGMNSVKQRCMSGSGADSCEALIRARWSDGCGKSRPRYPITLKIMKTSLLYKKNRIFRKLQSVLALQRQNLYFLAA